jgi:predicted PurR-regulated permease PerM
MEIPTVSFDRSRAAWWGIVLVLGVIFAWLVYSFVGTFVLGMFLYYAVRPLHEWVVSRVSGRSASTIVTFALVLIPILALVGYAGLVALRELFAVVDQQVINEALSLLRSDPESVRELVQSPRTVLTSLENPAMFTEYAQQGVGIFGTGANALLHLTLALAISFFLLRDGPRIEEWFRTKIADEDGIAEAYVTAVDDDLQTVYFGTVLSVIAVAAMSLGVYHGFNLVAPGTLRIPFPTLLALLTGLATFVPVVVGKLVYVPLSVYLAYATTQDGTTTGLVWIGAFALVSFVILDLLPQTFIRPYISGQSLHSGLVLLAYVLGAALFGWYGLFLGPLILVLVVQATNVVLPELLHGKPLTTDTHLRIGSDPAVERDDAAVEPPDGDGSTDAGASSDAS